MKVRIIEAKIESVTQKIRVCAYARVSSESLTQENSLQNQQETYERMIKETPEYAFVGVYADQGISGFSEKRPEFQKMIAKAMDRQIDLIITKSISRFARNTVTVLKYVRQLKEVGVGVLFEEQNINTLTGDGEMMLAVLSSFAQEESRSMSENSKWSVRKKFEQGKVLINTTRFLGYDKDEYGDLVINPKEAKIVQDIFNQYLNGSGAFTIAKNLNEKGIITITGAKWSDCTIRQMLRNEKYKGDYHLQKYYTPENSRHQSVRNHGEVQSYYIQENHPAIISIEDWNRVQVLMKNRFHKKKLGEKGTDIYKNRSELTGMLFCPYCKKALNRRYVYNRKVQWICSTYLKKGKCSCPGIRVDDEEAMKQRINEPMIVEEMKRDGKKYHCYTSKRDYENGIRGFKQNSEKERGSLLPSVHRPRRTAIKL